MTLIMILYMLWGAFGPYRIPYAVQAYRGPPSRSGQLKRAVYDATGLPHFLGKCMESKHPANIQR